MGTHGYAAPEYIATGRLTAKSDVYSFGVVLLELLTGRRDVDKEKVGIEQDLVEWTKPYLGDKRRLFRIMDTRLDQPGDLYVVIKVREDPIYRRNGRNINVDAPINIGQAILGGTVQVPTLTGDVVIKVRPGTQPGQKVTLKGKGIKTRNSYTYGDQIVHFNASIPTYWQGMLRHRTKQWKWKAKEREEN